MKSGSAHASMPFILDSSIGAAVVASMPEPLSPRSSIDGNNHCG